LKTVQFGRCCVSDLSTGFSNTLSFVNLLDGIWLTVKS